MSEIAWSKSFRFPEGIIDCTVKGEIVSNGRDWFNVHYYERKLVPQEFRTIREAELYVRDVLVPAILANERLGG